MNVWNWMGALALLVLGACAGGGKGGPQLIDSNSAERLHGIEWQLKTITVDGTRVIMHTDGDMTLIFGPNGQAGGYAAVNNFSGRYSFDQSGTLTWSESLAATRKAGPPELMEKERAYLTGIPKTTRAILSGNALQLQSEDGNTVLAFVKAGT
jgi:heat shock protein HslJ